MKIKTAILIGGPADGHALRVPANTPYILTPASRPIVTDYLVDIETVSSVPTFSTARYELEFVRRPESKVATYVFTGVVE